MAPWSTHPIGSFPTRGQVLGDDLSDDWNRYGMPSEDSIDLDPETHWKCRDGTIVAIREMGDRHLLNLIRFLERNYDRRELDIPTPPMFNGEDAQFFAERDYDNACEQVAEMAIEEWCPSYPFLVAEAKRRKLDPAAGVDRRPTACKLFRPHRGISKGR